MRNQMKIIGVLLGSFLFLVGVAGNGYASAIFSERQDITADAQNFTFDVFSAPLSAGTGTFKIEARGDYDASGDKASESLDWNIDSLASGSEWNGSNADSSVIYSANDDVWWVRQITIDAGTLAAITGDGMFTVSIDNREDVGDYSGDYVEWTLTYEPAAPVPVPAAIILLGSGLMGLVGVRRKFKE